MGVRWNATKEGKILASLFENSKADPRSTKAADIDPIKEMREEFKDFTKETFRNNYKTTATNWMAGKAVEVDNKFSEEEGDEEDIEPMLVDSPTENMTSTSANQTFKYRRAGEATAYQYKSDEQKWEAVHQSSKFISKGYHREELIIEPPASFDGSEGSYQASFDNNGSVFVLKIAPNPVLNDPHAINSYYENEYGIITADDSARDQAFKASARGIADKWYTFRHPLDWKGKPSDDLGRWWIDFTDIALDGRSYPLLIIQLSSVKPIEVQPQKVSGRLQKKSFKTPEKKSTTAGSAFDPKMQVIAMLKEIFPLMSEEAKEQTAKKYGLTAEDVASAMDIEREKKRTYTGAIK